MTSAVETMAYANQVPWHGIGTPVSDKLTPEQMRKAAKQDYTVSKRPVLIEVKGKTMPIKNKFALVRDSDDQFLSMVGSVYKPVQTEQVFDFFSKFVKAGKMKMETAGSLWEGRYVWALARTGDDFNVGQKDEMRSYLLLCSPFEHGKSLIMQWTSVRVVCWNTLTMAVGHNLKGKGHAFRMPHTRNFEVEKTEAERVMGLMHEQTDQFKEAAQALAKKKIKKDEVEKFFLDVLKKAPDAKRQPVALPKFKEALEKAPGAMLPSSKGTWWGALNAVTYVIDHESGRSRDTALKNAWLGHLATQKRRALDLALVGSGLKDK